MAGTEMDMVGVSTWLIGLTLTYRTCYHKSLTKELLKTKERWLDS